LLLPVLLLLVVVSPVRSCFLRVFSLLAACNPLHIHFLRKSMALLRHQNPGHSVALSDTEKWEEFF
jgi:hypothetical protein